MFIKPCEGRITSHFRTKERLEHHGIDMAQAGIVEIKAVANGTVSRSYTSSSYGEVIFIVHNIDGQIWESVYAHMKKGSRRYSEGQSVRQGDVIGFMGNTGMSNGQHLHFELHKGRWNHPNKTNAVDPYPLIKEVKQMKKENTISEWAKDAHKWVIDNKISDGTRAKDTVTREELWTMLYRMMKA